MIDQMMRQMGGPMAIMMIVIMGLLFVYFYFYIAVWLYRDAHKRGMEAAVWLFIYLIVGLVGLIIYFIVRKDSPIQTRVVVNEPTAQVRTVQTVSQEDRFCNECGTRLALDAKFCNSCGTKQ